MLFLLESILREKEKKVIKAKCLAEIIDEPKPIGLAPTYTAFHASSKSTVFHICHLQSAYKHAAGWPAVQPLSLIEYAF